MPKSVTAELNEVLEMLDQVDGSSDLAAKLRGLEAIARNRGRVTIRNSVLINWVQSLRRNHIHS